MVLSALIFFDVNGILVLFFVYQYNQLIYSK